MKKITYKKQIMLTRDITYGNVSENINHSNHDNEDRPMFTKNHITMIVLYSSQFLTFTSTLLYLLTMDSSVTLSHC